MSLPLKRRMARVALLVAAAAPVVGLAGSASAAGLPQLTDLGGLTSTDAASSLNGKVDTAAHQTVDTATRTGGGATGTLLPAAGRTLDGTGSTVTPLARKTVGDATGQVGHVAGHATKGAPAGKGLPGRLSL